MTLETQNERLPILDFIKLKQLKDGNYKISFPKEKAINIYKLLKEAGYAFTRVNKTSTFVQKDKDGINEVSFDELKDLFKAYLKIADYSILPDQIRYSEVMNSYYRNFILKPNKSLKAYLKIDLSADELHQLLLKTDHNYKKEYQIKTMLKQFEENQFKVAEDFINTYHINDKRLYYKRIYKNKYLIFNDIDDPKIKLRMFDCWISTFVKEKDIGKKQPLSGFSIMLNFKWEEDFQLIESYIN